MNFGVEIGYLLLQIKCPLLRIGPTTFVLSYAEILILHYVYLANAWDPCSI